MSDVAFSTPYASSPGTSTSPPGVGPEEGRKELWGFFWLSLVNTLIITVAGVGVWVVVH